MGQIIFPARYLINDAQQSEEAAGSRGDFSVRWPILVIQPGEDRITDASSRPPPGMVPSCQEAGILGAVAGVWGFYPRQLGAIKESSRDRSAPGGEM
ncbi:MAG: hypothetical protein H6751_02495 [Candidatus Omnitrophica bacterium]|nr:hypothetical protein [Candidatus Omnitrophota bacterium]